jgi:hypothetical protein
VAAQDGSNAIGPTPKATVAGCYGFADTLSSPSGWFMPVVAPVTATETAYLAPTITTQASSTPVNGDGPSVPGSAILADKVDLAGLGSTAATISWTVYGPVTGQACSTVNWASAPVFARGSEPVPGGSFTIAVPTKVVENGCYSFGDTVTSATGAFAPLTVKPGATSETVAGSIGAAGAIAGSSGSIAAAPAVVNSGHPGAPWQISWLIVTGIVALMLAAAAGVALVVERRRS